MTKFIPNKQAVVLGLRGIATYEDGSRPRPVKKPPAPPAPETEAVQQLAGALADAGQHTHALIERLAAALYAEHQARVEDAKTPERWRFTIVRDAEGRLTEILAEAVR